MKYHSRAITVRIQKDGKDIISTVINRSKTKYINTELWRLDFCKQEKIDGCGVLNVEYIGIRAVAAIG